MLQMSDRARFEAHIRAAGDGGLLAHTDLASLEPERELERIAFSRSREVQVEWDEVIAGDPSKNTPYVTGYGIEYMRRDMESRWGYPEGVTTDAQVLRISEDFVRSLDPPLVIFGIPNSQRDYLAVVMRNDQFQVSSDPPLFSTVAAYELFWKWVEKVDSADPDPTEMAIVDLAPAIIYRQYRELRALLQLGDSLAANADKIASREFTDFPSPEDLDVLTSGFLRMRSVKTDVEIKLERLRDRARDLGYYLALENETITLPDGSKDELEPGQLYQPYLTEFRWQTRHFKRYLVRSDLLLFNSSWIIQVPYYSQQSRKITRYHKIIPDFDPWSEKERELSAEGFNVYRFERIGERYVTVEGEPIEDIVERCELDIEFVKRCAVLIPVYEQSLVGGEILTRYIVLKRPRRGVQPLHLPRLYVEEDLMFSTHFHRVEVGELVQTINLAPGENREIVIEKTTLTEQESRRTATSISDLTETDRVDLSTEMERETTSSTEQTSTKSLSAKAGGSYGPFSASASGSTSSTSTTRQFARDLQKVANKASRSVTRQTRLEVKTSTSIRTNVSTRESTKIAIRNINDGRSLNLLFFQLYNIYRVELRLERMSFTMLSGREIIAGSGIVLPEVYSLDQLGTALERMDLGIFPIQPNRTVFTGPDPGAEAREAYRKLLVASIKQTLNEYKAGQPDSSESIDVDPWDPPSPTDPSRAHVGALAKALKAIRYRRDAIRPLGDDGKQENTLVVGSPGLYLDAYVGVRPGTEPYSESMRVAELEKRSAEVREINARAAYHEAMARRLARPDAGNVVTGRALDLRTLELTFASEPLQGEWSLYVADVFVTDFSISAAGLVHPVTFQVDQQWLSQQSVEVARITHKAVKQELVFMI